MFIDILIAADYAPALVKKNPPPIHSWFSSFQIKTVSTRSGKHIQRSIPSLRSFLDSRFKTIPLLDNVPFSPFQGRWSSASSFYASILRWSMERHLRLCAGRKCLKCLELLNTSDPPREPQQATCDGCFTRHSICSVISCNWHVQDNTSWSLWRRMSNSVIYANLGFSFRFRFFFFFFFCFVLASSLNLWWRWHAW